MRTAKTAPATTGERSALQNGDEKADGDTGEGQHEQAPHGGGPRRAETSEARRVSRRRAVGRSVASPRMVAASSDHY